MALRRPLILFMTICKENLSPWQQGRSFPEINTRLGIASSVMNSLNRSVWRFDICAEEQRSGCSEPWFSLSCYMAVRHGASEPVSAAV